MTCSLPPSDPKDLPDEARRAIRSAKRSAKKLRETKRSSLQRKLGHTLLIVENGQIKVVSP